MARFFGRYEHSLDPKGRVILPAKFRAAFDEGGFLTQFHDRCLALWTPDEFETQMRGMQEAQEQGREQRNLARLWSSGSADVEVDRQGRMPIPQRLREFARLDGDVLVIGAIDRVELWSPALWEAKVEASEGLLTDEDERAS
ncbi:MAG: transcriptional regulator MraZ [Acidimicrobiaceae bacterium]|nr:transcriptional regulator MraZ [Acidimicrobiaceae bacterium]MDQ1445739.1 transcriptional regulator MraZ [Acidimicrobiaceae bacterium]